MMSGQPKRLTHLTTRGRVRRWRQHKLQALATAGAYRHFGSDIDARRAARIQDCANRLDFIRNGRELRLRSSFSCKNRLCPVCAASKSRQDYAILAARVAIHATTYPRALPVMLTLTVPNVPTAELKPAITNLLAAFRRMWRMPRVKRAAMGWHRSLEITFKDEGKEAHPHLHVLMFMRPGYFTANSPLYLTQPDWCALWEKATGILGLILHIKRIGRDRDGELILANDGLFELTKYLVKPTGFYIETDEGDWELNPVLLQVVHDAVHRRRLRDVGGTVRKIKKPERPKRPTDAELEAAHTEIQTYLFGEWIDHHGEIHGPDYWARAPPEPPHLPDETPNDNDTTTPGEIS